MALRGLDILTHLSVCVCYLEMRFQQKLRKSEPWNRPRRESRSKSDSWIRVFIAQEACICGTLTAGSASCCSLPLSKREPQSFRQMQGWWHEKQQKHLQTNPVSQDSISSSLAQDKEEAI